MYSKLLFSIHPVQKCLLICLPQINLIHTFLILLVSKNNNLGSLVLGEGSIPLSTKESIDFQIASLLGIY